MDMLRELVRVHLRDDERNLAELDAEGNNFDQKLTILAGIPEDLQMVVREWVEVNLATARQFAKAAEPVESPPQEALDRMFDQVTNGGASMAQTERDYVLLSVALRATDLGVWTEEDVARHKVRGAQMAAELDSYTS